jgi:5'(3')-deoxyribonucleotidase
VSNLKKLNIVIDVDQTLLNPAKQWLAWLSFHACGYNDDQYEYDKFNNCIDYKLSNYFKLNNQVDGMGFWKQSDLYDDMQCYNEAIGVIKYLYQQGHNIIFASFCFPEHETSKVNMLKREFEFIAPEDFHFVSTKSKGFINADVIIDDRVDMLNQFDSSSNVLKIRIDTPYTQTEAPVGDITVVDSWGEVAELVRSTDVEDVYLINWF